MITHWIRLGAMTTIGLGCLAGGAAAQTQPCTAANLTGPMKISVDAGFAIPSGATRAFIPAAGAAPAQDLSAPSGDRWTAAAADVAKLGAAFAGGRRTIEFANAAGSLCARVFEIVPLDDQPGTPTGTTNPSSKASSQTYESSDACLREAGPKWESEIRASRKRQPGHFTMLIFLESGSGGDANICYANRDFGVAGDPIYVGIFRKSFTWTGVRFEPCAIQAAAPNILQSSDKFPSTVQGGGPWQLQEFLPRRCFNTAVDISVVGEDRGKAVTQRFPLSQYDRYRATLQAGILFTPLHDGDFALRTDQADPDKKFVFDRGPTNRGPEYIATLQLYSIFRYLPSLWGRPPYPGRDPINDQKLADRLGAILGVGIKNPGKRFVAGLSLELIYGVSAIAVIDFARVTRLHDSVSTTVPFAGAVTDIPTTLVWKHRTTFGLSIDLRYVATLFSGNR